MSNKIKSFYVNMTNATDEQIEGLHALCIATGASLCEDVETWIENKWECPLMGVDINGEIISLGEVGVAWFNNTEIKLEDVATYLGVNHG